MEDSMEKLIAEMEIEKEVADALAKVVDDVVFLEDDDIQMGGQRVLVEPSSGPKPPKDFGNNIIVRYFDVRFSRRLGMQPDAPEHYAKALIQIMKEHVPPNFRRDSKVGLTMESKEFEGMIGFVSQPMERLKTEEFVESMEKMSQSQRSPLSVNIPKFKVRINYITPPAGSGKRKKGFTIEDILDLSSAFEPEEENVWENEGDEEAVSRKRRRRNHGLCLQECEASGSEDEEVFEENDSDREFIDSDNNLFPETNYNAIDKILDEDQVRKTSGRRRLIESDDEEERSFEDPEVDEAVRKTSGRRRLIESDDEEERSFEDREDDEADCCENGERLQTSSSRRNEESDNDEMDDSIDDGFQSRRKSKQNERNLMKNDVSKDCLPHALYQVWILARFLEKEEKITEYSVRLTGTKNDDNLDTWKYRKLNAAVQKMKKTAGVTKEYNFTLEDVEAFQTTVFRDQWQILVFKSTSAHPIYSGPFVSDKKQLIIFLDKDHYQGVRKLSPLFGSKFVCNRCFKKAPNATLHYACAKKHRKYGMPLEMCPKTPEDMAISCIKCMFTFDSMVCFENHKTQGPKNQKSTCEKRIICKDCGVVYYNNKGIKHKCGMKYCHRCEKSKEIGHCCVMPVSNRNEKAITKRRIYFDVESRADDDGRQVPIYFLALKSCAVCGWNVPKTFEEADGMTCAECAPEGRTKIIECISVENRDVDVGKEMFAYLFQKEHRGNVVVAHNNSGYDGQFLLQEIIGKNVGEPTKLIMQGTKLKFMIFNGVRVMDSLNYLLCSLREMGKTFHVDVPKGDFPIKFIKPENYEYEGDIPDIEYYDIGDKSESEGERITNFVEEKKKEGYLFNFKNELANYCLGDVRILAEAFFQFENDFEKLTNVTILEESTTAASAAAKVFRRNFLQEDKPIMLDSVATKKGRSSLDSQRYLAYREFVDGLTIERSTKGKEKRFGPYNVDGYIEPCQQFPNGKIIEYNGCFYHAHDCGYDAETEIFKGVSAGQIRERDAKRMDHLKMYGAEIEIVWECKVQQQLQEDEKMANFYKNYSVPKTLVVADALTGGRTEVFKLYSKADGRTTIHYLDVASLYPDCMKHCGFPIGEGYALDLDDLYLPMKRRKQIDFDGFMTVTILPPKKLRLPVLPAKIDGKLFFALCPKCVKNRKCSDWNCKHSDEERSFNGTFTTMELKVALDEGYIITNITAAITFPGFALLQYDDNGNVLEHGLFDGYIDTMLKAKIYASGFPKGIESDEEKQKFVDLYKKKEGIDLDKNLFEVNPGKRQSAKSMLNSLWGKMAQRLDLVETSIVTKPASFWKMFYDPSVIIITVLCVGAGLIIKHKKRDECLEILPTSAMHLAAFTTSHARLKLYNFMKKVGHTRLLYVDTDSLIYEVKDGKDPLAEDMGEFLGQLTNELKGNMLEFVSLGPKTYAYREQLPDGTIKTVRKSKGIKGSRNIEEVIGFELMKKMMEEEVAGAEERTTVEVDQFHMKRNKEHQVFACRQKKKFGYTFEKRRVMRDATTVPFGLSL